MKNHQKTSFRDYEVIRYPLLTEKSNSSLEKGQYFFVVDLTATKAEVKRAIETLFHVTVVSVNTLIKKGKKKVFRGRRGSQSDVKRAMVRLQTGQTIDISAGV